MFTFKRFLLPVLLAVIIIGIATPAHAQTGYQLWGRVMSWDGDPAVTVLVTIYNGDSTTTDSEGYFYFYDLPPDMYYLMFQRPGMQTEYVVVDLYEDTYIEVEIEMWCFCGDVNCLWDGTNIADLTRLIDYIFKGGERPPSLHACDVNFGDGQVNILDVTFMTAYMFMGGLYPHCEPDCTYVAPAAVEQR